MLEKLADHFRSPDSRDYLQRVWLGEKLRQKVSDEYGIDCRVSVKPQTITIYADSQAEAQALELKRAKLMRSFAGLNGFELKIKVSSSL